MKVIKKNGFSLIELLLTLGVIVILAVAAFMIHAKVTDDLMVKDIIEGYDELYIAYNQADDLGYYPRNATGQHYDVMEMISPAHVKHLLSDKMQKLYYEDDSALRISKYTSRNGTVFLSRDPETDISYVTFEGELDDNSQSTCVKIATKLKSKPYDAWIGLTNGRIQSSIKHLSVDEITNECETGIGIFSISLMPINTD